MARGQKKIKRHQRIYGGRSTFSKVMGLVLAVIGLAGVACLGWVLYEPVSHFLSGTMQLPEEQTPSSAIEEEISQQDSVSQQLPEEPQTLSLDQTRGVYLPLSALQDSAQLDQMLAQLSQQGINCILIDAKNDQGQVLYQSANQTVAEVAAQIPGAVDLAGITALAGEKGISVVARIYAFQDPLCSLVLKKAAVKYQDTEMLWLDDAKENGGKSWLNPYSEVAQMYIADLSLECIRNGCAAVLLDGVQFPTGYSLDLAGYGAQTKSRQQALSDFVQDMDELLQENGGALIYASSAQAMLGLEASSYESGGLQYAVQTMCPDLRLTQLVSGSRPSSLADVADPAGQPAESVQAVLSELKQGARDKTFLPLLQAPGDAAEDAALQIQEQIRALEACGVSGYFLYQAEGNYLLS